MVPFLGHASWRLGLGTYQLGRETEGVVKEALRIGYRHIDTAALYRNEAAVASAIAASRVPRREMCIATKIQISDIRRLNIRAATEQALARLGEIDLLMLHNWHSNAPEAWALLAEELEAGRVSAIGVSNFGITDISALPGPVPTVNQIELSPFLQRHALREYCGERDIAIVAHSPFAKAKRFDEIGALVPPMAPMQFMLSWSMANAAGSLPRSSNPQHLRANYLAQDIRLNGEQSDAAGTMEDGFATHPGVLR